MSPDSRVRDWWDSLSTSERLELGRQACLFDSRLNQHLDWTVSWEFLMPFSQQRALIRYHLSNH